MRLPASGADSGTLSDRISAIAGHGPSRNFVITVTATLDLVSFTVAVAKARHMPS
jgi:hypothetical protein